jgi:hypothetical protein
VGNAGRHKLVTSVDILGGEYEDEEIARAEAMIRGADGELVDADEALKQARKDLQAEKEAREAERRARAAQRAHIRPGARYGTRAVDPFGLHDLHPVRERGWDIGKELSEKQWKLLESRGIDPSELNYTRAKQMIAVVFKRDLPTVKQVKCLERAGWYDEDVTFKEARGRIAVLAQNNWRRPTPGSAGPARV